MSHEWIHRVLEVTGFSRQLAIVIRNCLDGMSSQVMINNILTKKIHHGSGVRQRDSFAPLLFLLCIDPLLEKLETEGIFYHAHCDDLILGGHKSNIS